MDLKLNGKNMKAKITIEYEDKTISREIEANKLVDGDSQNGLKNKMNKAYRSIKKEIFNQPTKEEE